MNSWAAALEPGGSAGSEPPPPGSTPHPAGHVGSLPLGAPAGGHAPILSAQWDQQRGGGMQGSSPSTYQHATRIPSPPRPTLPRQPSPPRSTATRNLPPSRPTLPAPPRPPDPAPAKPVAAADKGGAQAGEVGGALTWPNEVPIRPAEVPPRPAADLIRQAAAAKEAAREATKASRGKDAEEISLAFFAESGKRKEGGGGGGRGGRSRSPARSPLRKDTAGKPQTPHSSPTPLKPLKPQPSTLNLNLTQQTPFLDLPPLNPLNTKA
jgi:hypothetical protein